MTAKEEGEAIVAFDYREMAEDLRWICEICAEEFENEVDLLAHQFQSSCERELEERYRSRNRRKEVPC